MPRLVLRPLTALLVLVLSWPAFAETPAPTRDVQRAKTQLEAGDFERAIASVKRALKSPNLPEPTQVEAYRLLGMAELYLGNEAEAREAYERLLELDPGYDIPRSAPPKVQAIYERIVNDLRRRRLPPVLLNVAAIPDVYGDAPLTVNATIQNLAPGVAAKLYYRSKGAGPFSSADFELRNNSYSATVPAYDLRSEDVAYAVEYYVEVADAAKRRLAGKATAEAPLHFQVIPADLRNQKTKKPFLKDPTFWAVGTTAVVLTVGGILLSALLPRP